MKNSIKPLVSKALKRLMPILVLCAIESVSAQTPKIQNLSPNIEGSSYGDAVFDSHICFGGTHAVFTTGDIVYDREDDESIVSSTVLGGIVTPIEGGLQRQILVGSRVVKEVSCGDTGGHFVFTTSASAAEEADTIHSQTIDGVTTNTVTQVLFSGQRFHDYFLSPTSEFLVYVIFDSDDNQYRFYKISIEGGSPLLFFETSNFRGEKYLFSPDSRYFVYSNNDLEVHSINMVSGVQVKLSDDLGVTSEVEIDLGSKYVVYRACEDSECGIYSTPIGGGDTIKISAPIVNDEYPLRKFKISSDGSRVIYMARTLSENSSRFYTLFMYSAAIRSDAAILLAQQLERGDESDSDALILENGGTFVYQSPAGDTSTLYAISIFGGLTKRLVPEGVIIPNPTTGGINNPIRISPDGSVVAFLASDNRLSPGSRGLYSTSTSSLDLTLQDYRANSIQYIQFSRDGRYLIYNYKNKAIFIDDDFPVTDMFFKPVTDRPVFNVTQGQDDFYRQSVRKSEVSAKTPFVIFQMRQRSAGFDLFSFKLPENIDGSFCFPIISKTGKVAVNCL